MERSSAETARPVTRTSALHTEARLKTAVDAATWTRVWVHDHGELPIVPAMFPAVPLESQEDPECWVSRLVLGSGLEERAWSVELER